MQIGKVVVAKTVSTRDFTAALAQNAGTFLSLDVKDKGLGINVDSLLRAVQITMVEDLDYDLWFLSRTGSSANNATDPDLNAVLGAVTLTVASRVAAAGLFVMYLDALQIPIYDSEASSKVHMALICRSVAGKSANAAGALKVQLVLEPRSGF